MQAIPTMFDTYFVIDDQNNNDNSLLTTKID